MFSKYTPLWMPKGSVRGLLALGFGFGFIYAVFVLPADQTAILGAMTGIVVKDYFDKRSDDDKRASA